MVKTELIELWTSLAVKHAGTARGRQFRAMVAGLAAWDGESPEPRSVKLVRR